MPAKIKKLTTKQILAKNLERKVPSLLQQSKVVLHNIRSMHNVGAAFRNADAFGIGEVLLSGYTPVPPRPEISKTALGAEKNVAWSAVRNFKTWHHKNTKNYLFAGIEQTEVSKPLSEFTPGNRPVCMVFGNEVTGLDESILPLMDHFIEIPQYGHKHSLNVSVSIGICLFSFLHKYKTSDCSDV